MNGLRVLIVDDEKNIRTTLSLCVEGWGCIPSEASSAESALALVGRQSFDVVFLDLQLGPSSGLDFIPRILAADPTVAIVMITAYATIGTAVEAIRRGARDYLPKPFAPPQIEHVLGRIAEERDLRRKVLELESRLEEVIPEVETGTQSPLMTRVLETARRAAASPATVLLRGENGTGKGVLARMIHGLSSRKDAPFGVVNCPALPEQLIASELFGHVQGSFTGALRDRVGRVELADGGTLFLDEIGELPLHLQTQLLRFLQEKAFERVGDSQSRRADVRIVAATNRDLEDAVKAGKFREDLLFRLNVVEITLPSLRERAEDILPLARRFLAFFARQARRPVPELSPEAESLLQGYSWPGNLRELRNAIERATILWPSSRIEPAAFPERMAISRPADLQIGGLHTLDQVERAHIEGVVDRTENLEEAARTLGINSTTLWRKRKRYESEGEPAGSGASEPSGKGTTGPAII